MAQSDTRTVDCERTARDVIDAVGGSDNVVASNVCMTRLRLSVDDVSLVDEARLNAIRSVLGVSRRGERAYDVIFVPSVIDDVYSDFVDLSNATGSAPEVEGNPVRDSPMRVAIAPGTSSPKADPEIEGLLGTLGEADASRPAPSPAEEPARPSVLVINGPNINMLGVREPDVYGTETFADLERLCRQAARECGFSFCRCFQSNHEGALVDEIQAALGRFAGIVINPGAYTHTSVAILDAVKAVSLPCVEVHISKVDEREDFRQVSYVRLACIDTVTGLGIEGYRVAMRRLADHLRIADA